MLSGGDVRFVCMLPDLFSSFDPGMRVVYRSVPLLFWGAVYLMTSVLSVFRFVESVRLKIVIGMLTSLRLGIVKGVKGSMIQGLGWLMTRVFVLLLMVNFSGLIPWVVRVSRHLVFRVALAFPL